MVRQLNKEIEDKLDEIVEYIKNTDSYKNYLKAKDILESKKNLKIIIENIKRLQKEIIKNPNNKIELESELNKNIKLLESDIVYNQYTNYLSDVNNMLAIFENKINKYFLDVFNQKVIKVSDNLYKVIELENNLTDLLLDGYSKDNFEVELIINQFDKILSKLNNKELLYLLKNGNSIHEVVDVANYLKKYKINKKELKLANSYTDELKKLNNFIELISDSSIDENEYMYICTKCDVDNVASYLLSKMSNEDIMKLSSETDDWNYKLFLYGNLKA